MLTVDQRMMTPGPQRGKGLTWAQIKELANSMSPQELERVALVVAGDRGRGYCYLTYAGPLESPLLIGDPRKPTVLAESGAPCMALEEGMNID